MTGFGVCRARENASKENGQTYLPNIDSKRLVAPGRKGDGLMISNRNHLVMARVYAALYALCLLGPLLAIALEEPTLGDGTRVLPVMIWYLYLGIGGCVGAFAALSGNMRVERAAMFGVSGTLALYGVAILIWGAGIPDGGSWSDVASLLFGALLFGPIRLAWHLHRPLDKIRLRATNPAMRGDAR